MAASFPILSSYTSRISHPLSPSGALPLPPPPPAPLHLHVTRSACLELLTLLIFPCSHASPPTLFTSWASPAPPPLCCLVPSITPQRCLCSLPCSCTLYPRYLFATPFPCLSLSFYLLVLPCPYCLLSVHLFNPVFAIFPPVCSAILVFIFLSLYPLVMHFRHFLTIPFLVVLYSRPLVPQYLCLPSLPSPLKLCIFMSLFTEVYSSLPLQVVRHGLIASPFFIV